jgi:tRNA G18 (ribose-2'-O)-methylase SpoU
MNPTVCQDAEKPTLYLVIFNIQKRNNVRSLLMTAAAFGIQVCIIVGQPKFDSDPDGPNVPSQLKSYMMDDRFVILRLETWTECDEYLRRNEIRLLGVEIHKDAKSVETFFDSNDTRTALLMGNEGYGLKEKQMDSCHGFIRIPQYGHGTASLNVNVAASIVLQRLFEHRRQLRLS